jgi:ATP-dependent protease ClpP protease subunit
VTGHSTREFAWTQRSHPSSPVKVTAAKIIIHEPWVQQVGGQATDFEIHARDLIATRRALAGKYEETIKKPIDFLKDIERISI